MFVIFLRKCLWEKVISSDLNCPLAKIFKYCLYFTNMIWLLPSLRLLFNLSHIYDYKITKRHYSMCNIISLRTFHVNPTRTIRVNVIICRNMKIWVETLFKFHQDSLWTLCTTQSVCIMCIRNLKLLFLACFMGGASPS